MAMRVRLAAETEVRHCYSPGQEVLRSLHVLQAVKRHPLHVSWALRTRARMSSALKRQADRFAFWSKDRPLALRQVWLERPATWADDLAALRRAPAQDFAEELAHAALLRNGLGDRLALSRLPDHPQLRALIKDPAGFRDGFADFLDDYWNVCLAPQWPGMQARLDQAVAAGLPLDRVSPHITCNNGEYLMRPPGKTDRPELRLALAGDDSVVLMPSHFVWPELVALAQRQERQTLTIIYSLPQVHEEGQPPSPPFEVLRFLRSAGDPTRLQILQLLAERPRSTQELAGLIKLTDAAISKHLKLLLEAGWVDCHRQSYYVYYRLRPGAQHELGRGLTQLLGQ
ncbi:ArsR family transcriptional regulator [Rhizocola hellebori]|uniref:ArsR family transcriptional regulator n=1 Tax=Rhizocola hellebori TaxID=1392758 RepID=A0A8J3VE42_9ACTN|nr:metalloregulator ArsR/SmtB family transcription factor [Rhizocola hellebori]GIH02967.1 ArsR family transcriptional regulator [Rhizocola hellebori]